MTYWIEALNSTSGPPAEPCSLEKLALARIFFWMPKESGFHYTLTVQSEYQAIRDRARRDDHLSWALVHISGVRPLPDPTAVETRAQELMPFHRREKDCQIVAECELTEIITLLTCDTDLLKRLRAKSRVELLFRQNIGSAWQFRRVPSRRGHPTRLTYYRSSRGGAGSLRDEPAASCPHHIATVPHIRNAGRTRVQSLVKDEQPQCCCGGQHRDCRAVAVC
jgi:hypothetical protein